MRSLVLTLAAVLLLSGCPSPPCSGIAQSAPIMAPTDGTGWSYDSEPAEVTLSVGFAGGCNPEEGPRPDAVQAEVLSPSNAVIPSEVISSSLGDPFTASATVRFLPTEGAGTYLITVTFLPVGGRQSTTRLVIADRRTEPPSLEIPRTCTHLSVMRSGSVVCDGVARWPDGHSQDVCVGSPHAAAGNTLWCHDGTTVSALVEENGAFQLRSHSSVPGSVHILAEENRAFVADRTHGLARLFRLTLEQSFPFGPPAVVLPMDPGALVLKGDVLFVASLNSMPDDFGLSVTRVCAFDVSGNNLSQGSCQDVPGDVSAAANGTFITNQGNSLRAFAGTPEGKLLLLDTFALPQGMTPVTFQLETFVGSWAQLFDFSGGSLVVRMKDGALHPEQFAVSIDSARPEYSWAASNTSTKLWRNDPP
jgi:hypothetical protein